MKGKIKKCVSFLIDKIKQNKSQLVMLFLLAFIVFIGFVYYNKYFYILKDPIKTKEVIMSYGKYSVLVFLALQVLQVVAFFIPGEIVQIAGGYIFGAFYGGALSLIGVSLGAALVFGISHIYGRPFIKKIISEKDFKFFDKLLKLGSINKVVFLLYLIPGIPKDALAYVCGISEITFKDFIIYSTVARLPCVFISTYFGAKLSIHNKGILIGIAVVMTILFVVGVYKGDKIIKGLIENKKNK